MSRLPSPSLSAATLSFATLSFATLATLAALAAALAGCQSAARSPAGPSAPEPISAAPVLAPVPSAPPTQLTKQERELIDDLTIAMYVDDFEVRRLAAEELGSIGPDARDALPELIRCAAARDKKEEPIASCAHSIVLIASGNDANALLALTNDFQLPLATKERALSAIGDLGGLATAALATIYIDACQRGPSATSAGAADHLDQTAKLALTQLARSPASARTYLDDERHGACGRAAIVAVGVIARR